MLCYSFKCYKGSLVSFLVLDVLRSLITLLALDVLRSLITLLAQDVLKSLITLLVLRSLITLLLLDVLGLQRAPPKLARGCLHPLCRASLRQLVVFDVLIKLFFHMNSFFFSNF